MRLVLDLRSDNDYLTFMAARLSPLALSMLQRLITSYDEWIVEGAEHDFALAQVLASTTAGAPIVAAFKAAVA